MRRFRIAFFVIFFSYTLIASAHGMQPPFSSGSFPPIRIGSSVIPLNGPWKFHTGDDPAWSTANFDDSGWEDVDLTPAAGAHDADVGLSGYVAGWAAKGHPAYSGFAWYRIAVSIDAPPDVRLALSGPPDVDDAYQIFANGQLLGNDGDFSRAVPVVYSIQPRMFPLPDSRAPASAAPGTEPRKVVVAFRVWMAADSLVGNPDGGGIHIAPAIGAASEIAARYRVQWMETIRGYIVDAVEPLVFLLLAVLACSLIAFEPHNPAFRWLAVALVLTALVRANQVLFFWTQSESIGTFTFARYVLLTPLGLAAWAMTWCYWFQSSKPKLIARAVAVLTAIYVLAELGLLANPPQTVRAGLGIASNGVRILFALLILATVVDGVRRMGRKSWLAILTAALISIGLFAQELSSLHVRSIWFPFDTGVSRTQFAYAAFAVVLFALLLGKLGEYASQLRNPVTP